MQVTLTQQQHNQPIQDLQQLPQPQPVNLQIHLFVDDLGNSQVIQNPADVTTPYNNLKQQTDRKLQPNLSKTIISTIFHGKESKGKLKQAQTKQIQKFPQQINHQHTTK